MISVTDIYVKSSDGINFYKISCKNHDGIISIKCNCRAGELTKLCRHKLDLMRGDATILYNDSDNAKFSKVMEWIQGSPFARLITDHDNIENEYQEKQRELRKIKEIIELSMKKGVKLL